jgi:hypothetical protein
MSWFSAPGWATLGVHSSRSCMRSQFCKTCSPSSSRFTKPTFLLIDDADAETICRNRISDNYAVLMVRAPSGNIKLIHHFKQHDVGSPLRLTTSNQLWEIVDHAHGQGVPDALFRDLGVSEGAQDNGRNVDQLDLTKNSSSSQTGRRALQSESSCCLFPYSVCAVCSPVRARGARAHGPMPYYSRELASSKHLE